MGVTVAYKNNIGMQLTIEVVAFRVVPISVIPFFALAYIHTT